MLYVVVQGFRPYWALKQVTAIFKLKNILH